MLADCSEECRLRSPVEQCRRYLCRLKEQIMKLVYDFLLRSSEFVPCMPISQIYSGRNSGEFYLSQI